MANFRPKNIPAPPVVDPRADVPADAGTGNPPTTQPVGPRVAANPPPVDLTGDILGPDNKPINPQQYAASQPNKYAKYAANWPNPSSIEQMSMDVANATGAGQSSAENLQDWNRKVAEGGWTPEQAYAEMTKKALEPDTSSRSGGGNAAGLFGGAGGLSGFLGSSLVPTDAGAFTTLQSLIQNILTGPSVAAASRLGGGVSGGSDSVAPASAAAPAAAATAPAATAATPAATSGGQYGATPAYPFTPSTGGADFTSPKSRDTQAAGSLLRGGGDNVGDQAANAGATTIPDRAADAVTSFFGLSPVLKAGQQMQKLNHPGDIIFGNPTGGPQGPTDPNLAPTTPEEQRRNAQIVASLLAGNEQNGGI